MSESVISSIVIAAISSGTIASIATAAINAVANKKSKESEKASLTIEGIVCLMGYTIKSECKNAIKNGSIDIEDLEQPQDLNVKYKAMGGNGFVKNLMERVEKLPINKNN